ncbi:MAG: Fe-S cluster assembly protein NifU [Deltaproteobacteria bacterium]|nr:Fe-S cluster assembly protein NifU [Deltaproteobacteria bacterium]MBM4322870.1 Fe-S cluster assembly protein NifU [Deltaproteobacteria bacterium]MBM4346923.1 Fe-S cluster assembly protein NifU [Deltaproteobacteria bacterium]
MWDYTEKVKDHFLNPRNVGEIENPDGAGEVGSLACGDALRLSFKLDEQKKIKEAKFKTFGCASAIASSSALTEIIKGMTLEEAEKVTNQDIANYLGGLPEEKMHCSVMGREALESAIANYRGQKVVKEDFEIVCKCFGVTDREIIKAIRENDLKTVEQVTYYTKAGGGCAQCHPKIEAIIEQVRKEMEKEGLRPKPEKRKLTNIQKIKLIEETLGREIVPALKADGGDIDLIDVDGSKVYVALRGKCSFCPSSEFTLKQYVESKLKEFVSDDLVVEEVKP